MQNASFDSVTGEAVGCAGWGGKTLGGTDSIKRLGEQNKETTFYGVCTAECLGRLECRDLLMLNARAPAVRERTTFIFLECGPYTLWIIA
jgi:hypothetical protein